MDSRMSSSVSASVGDVVDCWFFRAWSRWPLCIGMDAGGYLARVFSVRPGILTKCFRRAMLRVDREGENNEA
jgi:hypothetical protein